MRELATDDSQVGGQFIECFADQALQGDVGRFVITQGGKMPMTCPRVYLGGYLPSL